MLTFCKVGPFFKFIADGATTDVFLGLGHAWLLSSQVSLARIHLEEGSSSGGEYPDQ
jgi:hypothetical protein